MTARTPKLIDTARLASRFDRAVASVRRKPEIARATENTTARLLPGGLCRMTQGPWTLESAIPPSMGGEHERPDPGVLVRAALGSCVALTFALFAARRDVEIRSLEVEVAADYDGCGFLGVKDVPAGYSEVRLTTRVDSPAEDEVLQEILDEALTHSPYYDVFTRAQNVKSTLTRTQLE